MTDNTLNINTRFNADEIRQSVGGTVSVSDKAEEVIRLKDQGVRRALHELGWLSPEEGQELRETARLAERFARAKGRHHSQHAACDLMEHLGLPCVRTGEEAPQPTPEAWMYQHDETGQIGFVDQWQIDNGFEKNNPRLHIICPLYRHPPGTGGGDADE